MLSRDSPRGWALLTGACSGIGLEIARDLAKRGYALVLVSNDGVRLDEAARSIAVSGRVPVETIVLDLAAVGAAEALHHDVARRGLDIEILVSNAGMFFYGDVADADPAQIERMMQLHVLTPSLLARRFAPDMRTRRRGYILLVSSISAWRDFPDIACYGASKRYLRSFAVSLRHELAPWGVSVTCLAPGPTATDLYGRTSIPVELAVQLRVMKPPAGVARAGVRAMFAGRRMVIPGLGAKVMTAGMMLLPRGLIQAVHRWSHTRSHGSDEER
jgi:uncharacterized protein